MNDRVAMERATQPTNAPRSKRNGLAELAYDARYWKAVLQDLIRQHNWRRAASAAVVSHQTMKDRAAFLFNFFRTLREKAIYLDPRRLKERHVRLVVEQWLSRELSPATLQKYLSHLRTFGDWIDKPGLVRASEYYVTDPNRLTRQSAAQADKSWPAHDIDPEALIAKIGEFDAHVGLALTAMRAFGLRPKEAIMLRPGEAIVPADQVPDRERVEAPAPVTSHYLFISRGAKGGRPRYIPIDSPDKWRVAEALRTAVGESSRHLGDPALSLKQNIRRFRYVLRRFGVTKASLGVTSYGLRHGFAHRTYEAAAGVPPPVKERVEVDSAADTAARAAVAQHLGHSRTRIAGAYVGTVRPAGKPERA